MRLSFWILLCSVLFGLSACDNFNSSNNKKKSNEAFDTQYLPDGVETAAHRPYVPDGKNFQGARIHPPFWWTGMARDTLQLLIYDQNIAGSQVNVSYEGVTIVDITSLSSPNYIFATLVVSGNARPGAFPIRLVRNGEVIKTYSYELKARDLDADRIESVSSDDLMYLIMPDRFANGDPANDSFDDMLQTGIDRSKMYFRHGGDLQGIINHLDYLTELGVTALWMTPLLENDQPYASYHGYAITDLYNIDRRFGSNEQYVALSSACQEKGIKLVKDLVFNHVGNMNWFIQDIPSHDWIHQFDKFTNSNHSSPVVKDPYGSAYDRNLMFNGWFDHSMPDLNQKNPYLAEYLIQNAIWWIEYAGVDGLRLDTYQYPDQDFMREMGRRVLFEYPDYYYFGEANVPQRALQSSFVKGGLTSPPGTVMPGVCDFILNKAIKEALTQEPHWGQGVYEMYNTLADDFLYTNPLNNVIFLDNHDMDRIYAYLDYNPVKLKSALSLVMTMRGIPCIYYGTEFGFGNMCNPDGKVRQDVSGGWSGDEQSLFEESGRSVEEEDLYRHIKSLADYRKKSEALRRGKTTHFSPHGINGIYTYFRTSEADTVMVVFNSTPEEKNISLQPYQEFLKSKNQALNVISGETVTISDALVVPAHATIVLDL